MFQPNFNISNNTIISALAISNQGVTFGVDSINFPLTIGILAQPSEGVTPVYDVPAAITSEEEAGKKYGYGSPIHLIAKQLYNSNRSINNIPCYVFPVGPIAHGDVSTGSIKISGTVTGDHELTLQIGSSQYFFSVSDGQSATDTVTKIKTLIDADLSCPVTSGTISSDNLPLTAKWKGTTSNDIKISFNPPVSSGITATLTLMNSGTGDVDLKGALSNFNSKWYNMIISQFTDSASLTNLQNKFIELNTPLKHSPFMVFVGGDTEKTPINLINDYSAFTHQPFLSVLSIPKAQSLPFEGAASYANAVGTTAAMTPARPYNQLPLYGIIEANEFTEAQANQLELGGITPTYITGGQLYLFDAVTTFLTAGNVPNNYRYVVNLIKLMQMDYDLIRLFSNAPYKQAILVDDDNPAGNMYTVRPAFIKGDLIELATSWAEKGLIQGVKFTQKNITVGIDSINTNKVNIAIPVYLSGALRQVDIVIGVSTQSYKG